MIDKERTYTLIHKLGEGSYGSVYVGFDSNDQNTLIAIKVMKRCSEELVYCEVRNLIGLNHPGIIKLVAYGIGARMASE